MGRSVIRVEIGRGEKSFSLAKAQRPPSNEKRIVFNINKLLCDLCASAREYV
jgi:hypothetical protein